MITLNPTLASGRLIYRQCLSQDASLATLIRTLSCFFYLALFYSALQKSIFPTDVATFICMPHYHILGLVKEGAARVWQESLK